MEVGENLLKSAVTIGMYQVMNPAMLGGSCPTPPLLPVVRLPKKTKKKDKKCKRQSRKGVVSRSALHICCLPVGHKGPHKCRQEIDHCKSKCKKCNVKRGKQTN